MGVNQTMYIDSAADANETLGDLGGMCECDELIDVTRCRSGHGDPVLRYFVDS